MKQLAVLHFLALVAATAVACGGQPAGSPTSPTLSTTMLAPPPGVTASIDNGTRADGPELQAQNCSQERSMRSTEWSVPATIEFVNLSGSAKVLHWLNYTGERMNWGTLHNGRTHLQTTYVTHPWLITDEGGTCIAIYAPTAQPSTVTFRDSTPLSAALIASSLGAEINRSFIATMQSADVPALVQTRAGVASCSGGGSVRVQHLGPAPGGGRVTLANTPTIFSGCTYLLGGRSIVTSGTVFANGFWTATEPTSPVRLSGDVEVEGLGPITIDGVTGSAFDGRIGGIGVHPGPPDTQPTPNPPATGIAKYDGVYDFTLTIPTGNGTQTTQTVRRFWHVNGGVISSSDGALRGSVDGSGGVRFSGVCPINSELADWTGNLDWTAQPGFNHGEGRYVCRMPISGNLTWRVQQTR